MNSPNIWVLFICLIHDLKNQSFWITHSPSSHHQKPRYSCLLWISKHHLQQCFLRSKANPHWWQMKLWQISCSGHRNSSLAFFTCLCYRLYPIQVWPTLLLMRKLMRSSLYPTNMLLDYVSYTMTRSKHQPLIKLTIFVLICPHQPPVVEDNLSFNMLYVNTRLHTNRTSCTTL